MKNKSVAIGKNMTSQKVEYFREILEVAIIQNYQEVKGFYESESYENRFRAYYIYKEGKILTYIEETFLPDFEKYC